MKVNKLQKYESIEYEHIDIEKEGRSFSSFICGEKRICILSEKWLGEEIIDKSIIWKILICLRE